MKWAWAADAGKAGAEFQRASVPGDTDTSGLAQVSG